MYAKKFAIRIYQTMKQNDYSWVTDEMFENKLEDLVGKMSTVDLMAIPGINEILREELNNEVLDELEQERQRPA